MASRPFHSTQLKDSAVVHGRRRGAPGSFSLIAFLLSLLVTVLLVSGHVEIGQSSPPCW